MRLVAFCVLIVSMTVQASGGVSLVGDKDGFGVGCPITGGLNYLNYGQYWADYRQAGDPLFTDYWGTDSRSWTQDYTPGAPTSASLEVFLAGIADEEGWTADVIFEGTTIGSIPTLEGGHDVTRLVTFNVPVGLLDGSSAVQIVPSSIADGYIVDYAELTIQTGGCTVPAPGAILLGAMGAGLVGWLRRRRAL